jgi:hypothetical protein
MLANLLILSKHFHLNLFASFLHLFLNRHIALVILLLLYLDILLLFKIILQEFLEVLFILILLDFFLLFKFLNFKYFILAIMFE